MFFQPLDLTTALRPSSLPDETSIYVQDAVGLYEGKYKLPNQQNGHVYLTSHRVCYVDNAEPRKYSVAVDLKGVERYEFYAGFLKSSAKVTLYPKPVRRSAFPSRTQSAASTQAFAQIRSSHTSPSLQAPGPPRSPLQQSSSPNRSVTWICPICSQSNQLPAHFDASTANTHTNLSACSTCGVKPSLAHVLKAAISSASGRSAAAANQAPGQPLIESHRQSRDKVDGQTSTAFVEAVRSTSGVPCPRCTFHNHPSLPSCELCGTPLTSNSSSEGASTDAFRRSDSPGPMLEDGSTSIDHSTECVKFSFRAGGGEKFRGLLQEAMQQRKWLLQNAPPVPKPDKPGRDSPGLDGRLNRMTPDRSKSVGIAGLERRGQELRKNNEVIIGDAFEDLEALMASAKEIIALAEAFASKSSSGSPEASAILQESATALSMVTTKAMVGSNTSSETLYISELSRNLAESLTDDAKGILRKEGGIMSLVDLWAIFNRSRGGVELVSPLDFEKAARLWEKLHLPVRLRQFRNGLLVVQQHDRTDDKTIAQILNWLQGMHIETPPEKSIWDAKEFGRGVTAHEAAQYFGWSLGVATEELEMAEEKGSLCREDGVEGVRFWENFIGQEEATAADGDMDVVAQNLEKIGLL